MILVKTSANLQNYLTKTRSQHLKTGFVPTMGALHQGHLSLIAESKRTADVTICSIFVNPTQFNDPADFAKYPVTIENDIYLLETSGCDVLFLPSVDEIYPSGTAPAQTYDLGGLDQLLEGAHRPGHFQGVCQVMDRLLSIVEPDLLFMGQKDYQQCMVVQRLIDLQHWPIELKKAPIMRETSGLAMSSRNTRLSAEGREKAAAIFAVLINLRSSLLQQSASAALEAATASLLTAGFEKIDYVVLADPQTLAPVWEWDRKTPVVALVAAFIEGVRLIDNILMTPAD